jgi:hypothetical protein
MHHPDQKKYALLSALTGLAAIIAALAMPACTNGKAEDANLTGPQLKLQRECDHQRKDKKQQFVIQHRLAELKTQIEALTTTTTPEERSELGNQSNVASSALTNEEDRKTAIQRFEEIENNVATRIHKDLKNPKGNEGTKLKYENSTFNMRNKNIFGLALRQTYEQPSEHQDIHSVILLAHPKEVRTLIFVEKENHDVPLMTHINEQLPEDCASVPSKLDEYYFNTMIDGLKM